MTNRRDEVDEQIEREAKSISFFKKNGLANYPKPYPPRTQLMIQDYVSDRDLIGDLIYE